MGTDAIATVLRALGFIALFQAAGAAIFLASFASTLQNSAPALRRFGVHMAWIAMVLVAAQFVLEPVRMAGEWSGLQDESLRALALGSSMARACAGKLAGLTILLSAMILRPRHGDRIALCGALIALSAFLFTGHTAAHPLRFWMAPLLLLHLWVVAFWFGALLPLWQISRLESAVIAGTIIHRFSARAVKLVPALFVAGALLATLLLPDTAALQRPYGRLLLAKICAFALLMGLAALNKWRFGPAIARGDAAAGRSFRVVVALESVVIAAALAATAVLTLLYSPAH